jgi:hypothetical protein
LKKLLLVLLLSFSFASTINLESSVEHFKVVNGDAGMELLIKGNMRLLDNIPIVWKDDLLAQFIYGAYFGLGFSQQYTAPRSSQFSYNHYGDRIDFSLGAVVGNVEAIYTHSMRKKYAGANPDVIFFNSDIDSIKLRYKTEFNL